MSSDKIIDKDKDGLLLLGGERKGEGNKRKNKLNTTSIQSSVHFYPEEGHHLLPDTIT